MEERRCRRRICLRLETKRKKKENYGEKRVRISERGREKKNC